MRLWVIPTRRIFRLPTSSARVFQCGWETAATLGLTNAFSRKLENHAAAVALYYFAYNFIKIHSSLRCTPAMAASVTDRLWEVSDLVALLEADERRVRESGVR